VAYETGSNSPSVSGSNAHYSISESIQLTGRPLLKPDEVVRLLATTDAKEPRQAIHFLRGVPRSRQR
jgi:hypothetical protein